MGRGIKRAGFAALVALIAAAPAWARVDISAAQVGDTNEVIISYDATGEANLVRAFAFDIQLDNDANILEVTGLSADYYIYPGTIQINANGDITFYGSPVAPHSDLPGGTLTGPPDSNGVTIEMASLYAPVGPGSPNAPAQSGDLLSIIVSEEICVFPSYTGCAPVSEYCCITISGNVARAGSTGVVMEDPNEVVEVYFHNICDSPPPGCIKATSPDYEDWIDLDCPECWCHSRQCHGDADGVLEGDPKGGYFRVGAGDLGILLANWKILVPAVAPTPGGPGIPPDCLDVP